MGSIGASPPVCLVVPCYRESERLDPDAVAALADGTVTVLLVDDGSPDATPTVLNELAGAHDHVEVLALPHNVGKGEAVRRGLLHCLGRSSPQWVGYVDADFATPVDEIARLASLALADPGIDVLLASRVAMLGRTVERSPFRHYTGRVFATGASLVLGKAVYDTQCGTKFFRVGPALHSALTDPFRSRWAFDVELLGRLAIDGVPPERFREEPLRRWSDASGSKRSLSSSVRSTLDLVAIRSDLDRRRRS